MSRGAWLMACLPGLMAGCGERAHANLTVGREVYTLHCSSCHQPDGRGYDDVYPNLAGNPIVRLSSPEPMTEIVRQGRGSMPPFGEELTPRELADVISYVRHAWGNQAAPVTPRQVG
jgi:mono/diheme cytochrome c family protein